MSERAEEVEMEHQAGDVTPDELLAFWDRVRQLWAQGPVKILAMLAVGTLAAWGGTAYTINAVQDEPARNCEILQDAVGKVRLLADLAVSRARLTAPVPSWRTFVPPWPQAGRSRCPAARRSLRRGE